MPTDEIEEPRPTCDALLELLRPGALIAKLERSFPGSSLRGVQIGFVHGTDSCHATYPAAESPVGIPPNPTGCLTKLLTATLAHLSIADGHFDLDSTMASLLGIFRTTSLSTVTVRHLLEHTHGLDDSGLPRAPVKRDGFIDVHLLEAQLLRSPPLAEPGSLYSYSNAGAWLIAALLERVHGAPYETLLRARLFQRIGAAVGFRGQPLPGFTPHEICPANGNVLAVCVEDVTKFLQVVLAEERQEFRCIDWSAANIPTTPLPGWHSVETGVRLGWKCYGPGWFGHNSEHLGAPALLRVHPRWRIGVFITAASPSPMSIGATLFRNALPGFANARMPRLLRKTELEAFAPSPYIGRYANGTREVEVLAGTAAPLQVRVYGKPDGAVSTDPFFTASLQAAQWETFFPLPAEPTSFPFVQFLEPTARGFGYLWNGKTLWPRIDGAAP